CRDHDTCMFVTRFCGVLDMCTGSLHYSNGGHTLPYVMTRQGIQSVQGTEGTALGLVDEAAYRARKVVLAPGDALFLYTDGVTEAMDEAGNMFMEARLSFFRINATQALKMQLTQRLCCMIPESMGRTVPYAA